MVKPPNMPVYTKARHSASIKVNFEDNPISNPVRKHPIILTNNVLTGNFQEIDWCNKNPPNLYRIMAPRHPPRPTSSKVFICHKVKKCTEN